MNKTKNWLLRVTAPAVALALTSTAALAAATANADATGVADDAEATFTYILPKAIAILGTFLGIAIGVKVWKRITR